MSNPKWLDLPGYVSIKLVGIGMIAFGVWMYNTGQAITEDAVIPWILNDDFWASRDCRGIYRAGQWIIRKTRNVLGKEKTKNANKEIP